MSKTRSSSRLTALTQDKGTSPKPAPKKPTQKQKKAPAKTATTPKPTTRKAATPKGTTAKVTTPKSTPRTTRNTRATRSTRNTEYIEDPDSDDDDSRVDDDSNVDDDSKVDDSTADDSKADDSTVDDDSQIVESKIDDSLDERTDDTADETDDIVKNENDSEQTELQLKQEIHKSDEVTEVENNLKTTDVVKVVVNKSQTTIESDLNIHTLHVKDEVISSVVDNADSDISLDGIKVAKTEIETKLDNKVDATGDSETSNIIEKVGDPVNKIESTGISEQPDQLPIQKEEITTETKTIDSASEIQPTQICDSANIDDVTKTSVPQTGKMPPKMANAETNVDMADVAAVQVGVTTDVVEKSISELSEEHLTKLDQVLMSFGDVQQILSQNVATEAPVVAPVVAPDIPGGKDINNIISKPQQETAIPPFDTTPTRRSLRSDPPLPTRGNSPPPTIRVSTRISEKQQREMADKILEENRLRDQQEREELERLKERAEQEKEERESSAGSPEKAHTKGKTKKGEDDEESEVEPRQTVGEAVKIRHRSREDSGDGEKPPKEKFAKRKLKVKDDEDDEQLLLKMRHPLGSIQTVSSGKREKSESSVGDKDDKDADKTETDKQDADSSSKPASPIKRKKSRKSDDFVVPIGDLFMPDGVISHDGDEEKEKGEKEGKGEKQEELEEPHEEQESTALQSDSDDSEIAEPDSDYEAPDDQLYCICKKPYGNRFMICCDKCESWYHGSCMGISVSRGKEMDINDEEYICPLCTGNLSEKQRQMIRNAELKNVGKVPRKRSSHSKSHDSSKSRDRPKSHDSSKSHDTKSHDTKSHDQPPGEASELVDKRLGLSAGYLAKTETDVLLDDGKVQTDEANKERAGIFDTVMGDATSSDTSATNREESSDGEALKLSEGETLGEIRKRSPESGGLYQRKRVMPEDPRLKKYRDPKRHQRSKEKCIVPECTNMAHESALYCGKTCVATHASESLRIIRQERYRTQGTVKIDNNRKVVVLEPKTGRVITGPPAPTEGNLVDWLIKHPSFQTMRPTGKFTPSKGGKDSGVSSSTEQSTDTDEGPNPVRMNVRKALRDAFDNRLKNADDIMLSNSEVKSLTLSIEEELYRHFNETGNKYRMKYRSLLFNIRDVKNEGLFRKILTGKIKPYKLVRMTADELASKELAKWRKLETKHTLQMIEETEKEAAKSGSHVVKKTHKGEVEVKEESLTDLGDVSEESEISKTKKPTPAPILLPGSDVLGSILGDTTNQHKSHLFDPNCKICTGKIVPPSPSIAAKRARVVYTVSREGEEEKPEDKPEPMELDPPPEKEEARIEDSVVIAALDAIQKVQVDQVDYEAQVEAEVREEMEGREDEPDSPVIRSPDSVLQSGLEKVVKFEPSSPAVWKGFIHMQDVGKFATAAYRVSGRTEHLSKALADTIEVCGRLSPEQVWDYLSKIRQLDTKELCVVRFIPGTNEEKSTYIQLYSYLNSRGRCGVVANPGRHVKDMYIYPLSSQSKLPTLLTTFETVGLEANRPHMLLGLIVKQKQKRHVSSDQKRRHHGDSTPSETKKSRKPSSTPSSATPPTTPVEAYDPEQTLKETWRSKSSRKKVDPIVKKYSAVDADDIDEIAYSPGKESEREEAVVSAHTPKASKVTINSMIDQISQGKNPAEVTAATIASLASSTDYSEQKRLLLELTKRVDEQKRLLAEKQSRNVTSSDVKSTPKIDIKEVDPRKLTDDKSVVSSVSVSDISTVISSISTAVKANIAKSPDVRSDSKTSKLSEIKSPDVRVSTSKTKSPLVVKKAGVAKASILKASPKYDMFSSSPREEYKSHYEKSLKEKSSKDKSREKSSDKTTREKYSSEELQEKSSLEKSSREKPSKERVFKEEKSSKEKVSSSSSISSSEISSSVSKSIVPSVSLKSASPPPPILPSTLTSYVSSFNAATAKSEKSYETPDSPLPQPSTFYKDTISTIETTEDKNKKKLQTMFSEEALGFTPAKKQSITIKIGSTSKLPQKDESAVIDTLGEYITEAIDKNTHSQKFAETPEKETLFQELTKSKWDEEPESKPHSLKVPDTQNDAAKTLPRADLEYQWVEKSSDTPDTSDTHKEKRSKHRHHSSRHHRSRSRSPRGHDHHSHDKSRHRHHSKHHHRSRSPRHKKERHSRSPSSSSSHRRSKSPSPSSHRHKEKEKSPLSSSSQSRSPQILFEKADKFTSENKWMKIPAEDSGSDRSSVSEKMVIETSSSVSLMISSDVTSTVSSPGIDTPVSVVTTSSVDSPDLKWTPLIISAPGKFDLSAETSKPESEIETKIETNIPPKIEAKDIQEKLKSNPLMFDIKISPEIMNIIKTAQAMKSTVITTTTTTPSVTSPNITSPPIVSTPIVFTTPTVFTTPAVVATTSTTTVVSTPTITSPTSQESSKDTDYRTLVPSSSSTVTTTHPTSTIPTSISLTSPPTEKTTPVTTSTEIIRQISTIITKDVDMRNAPLVDLRAFSSLPKKPIRAYPPLPPQPPLPPMPGRDVDERYTPQTIPYPPRFTHPLSAPPSSSIPPSSIPPPTLPHPSLPHQAILPQYHQDLAQFQPPPHSSADQPPPRFPPHPPRFHTDAPRFRADAPRFHGHRDHPRFPPPEHPDNQWGDGDYRDGNFHDGEFHDGDFRDGDYRNRRGNDNWRGGRGRGQWDRGRGFRPRGFHNFRGRFQR